MEDFMASSPPAWNAEIPRPPSTRNIALPDMEEENDWDEDDAEIQDIPNAHFDVLKTTDADGEWLRLGVPAIAAETNLEESGAPPTRPISQLTRVNDKVPKPKWHFGIRSRSPPMEVMLEIYKTLSLLGMQWKRKEGIDFPEIGPEPSDGYSIEVQTILQDYLSERGEAYPMGRKAPPKKEILAREKAAQDLYLVQTRARYGTVMVSHLDLSRQGAGPQLTDLHRSGWTFSCTRSMPRTTWSTSRTSATTRPPTRNSRISQRRTPTLCRAVTATVAVRLRRRRRIRAASVAYRVHSIS